MKIHQLIWTNIKKETLHINYLSCCECMKKLPCIHYALSPNSYSPSTQLKNNAKRVRSAKNIAVQSSNQIKKISEESSNQKIVRKKKNVFVFVIMITFLVIFSRIHFFIYLFIVLCIV